MHYTGTIWRPPYEAGSLLIQVTAGCTHHRCKFCTLYDDLPFRFRLSPMEEVEADLLEAQMELRGIEEARLKLGGLERRPQVGRVFLVGANPFALAFMDKGYPASEIVTQAGRLDQAGIRYFFMYLAGLSGEGKGEEGAAKSAAIFNQTRPQLIGSSMLTVWPGSRLHQEMEAGNWREESEREKLRELRALVAGLEIPTRFATLGASNAVWAEGKLPQEKARVLADALATQKEESLRLYRETLPHL